MKDALYGLPKTIPKILNPPLAAIGNTEDSHEEKPDNDLEGQGTEKTILPSHIIVVYNILEVLLRLKKSGHTNFSTERSNLIDEFYKRGEIQNEQQDRTALDIFHSQQMELPSKNVEEVAINTRPIIEEHTLSVMDKSTHEKRLSQHLEPNNNQFKIAIT